LRRKRKYKYQFIFFNKQKKREKRAREKNVTWQYIYHCIEHVTFEKSVFLYANITNLNKKTVKIYDGFSVNSFYFFFLSCTLYQREKNNILCSFPLPQFLIKIKCVRKSEEVMWKQIGNLRNDICIV